MGGGVVGSGKVVALAHPFDGLPAFARAVLFLAAGATLVYGQGVFGRLRPAKGPTMVAFEWVATPRRAREVFDPHWDDAARACVAKALRFDTVVFVPAYVLLLTVLTLGASRLVDHDGATDWFVLLAWSPLVAGALDVLENLALLRILPRLHDAGPLTYVATVGAAAKFLVLGVIMVSLVGILVAPSLGESR